MENVNQKIESLIRKVKKSKISISSIKSIKNREKEIYSTKIREKIAFVFLIIVSILIYNRDLFFYGDCLLEMSDDFSKAFRPPEMDCGFCEIQHVKYEKNLSPNEFEEKYAYSGVPVIITDAQTNWTAGETFDYWYFKEIYEHAKRRRKTLNCQFFPYKSGLKNLYDAFKMAETRVNYVKGERPWYFGWSNCNPDVAQIFRQHYGRPYFLPASSENNAIDWIFIGGTGMGAHMHVDNVRLPSWQAQLKGTKEWILAPPPECYYKCNFFKVVVNPGDIIVLDTNRWYHQTNVLSGEISVTIGAEYD